jgi:hypothetical protein
MFIILVIVNFWNFLILIFALILRTSVVLSKQPPKFKISKIDDNKNRKHMLYITQNMDAVRKKMARERIKCYVLKQMYFSGSK